MLATHQLNFISRIPQSDGPQRRQGSAVAMPGERHGVTRTGLEGRINLSCQVFLDSLPRLPESAVRTAAEAQLIIQVLQDEIQVRDPSAKAPGSAERQHQALVSRIGGQKPSDIAVFISSVAPDQLLLIKPPSTNAPVEFDKGFGVGLFHCWTVALLASHFGPGGLEIFVAVRCGRILCKEGKFFHALERHICSG